MKKPQCYFPHSIKHLISATDAHVLILAALTVASERCYIVAICWCQKVRIFESQNHARRAASENPPAHSCCKDFSFRGIYPLHCSLLNLQLWGYGWVTQSAVNTLAKLIFTRVAEQLSHCLQLTSHILEKHKHQLCKERQDLKTSHMFWIQDNQFCFFCFPPTFSYPMFLSSTLLQPLVLSLVAVIARELKGRLCMVRTGSSFAAWTPPHHKKGKR